MMSAGGGVDVMRFAAAKKPPTVVCPICGRQYGTSSISIHMKTCQRKFEEEQAKLPPAQRKKVPVNVAAFSEQALRGMSADALDRLNADVSKQWNEAVLTRCENCGRTFLPDRLAIHQRSCTTATPARAVTDAVRRGAPGGGATTYGAAAAAAVLGSPQGHGHYEGHGAERSERPVSRGHGRPSAGGGGGAGGGGSGGYFGPMHGQGKEEDEGYGAGQGQARGRSLQEAAQAAAASRGAVAGRRRSGSNSAGARTGPGGGSGGGGGGRPPSSGSSQPAAPASAAAYTGVRSPVAGTGPGTAAAGLPQSRARTHARLASLLARIEDMQSSFNTEVDTLRSTFATSMDQLQSAFDAEMALVKGEVEGVLEELEDEGTA